MAGTVKNLNVKVSIAAGGSRTWTFTIDKNNGAQTLTCVTTAGTGTTCSDTNAGHAFTVKPRWNLEQFDGRPL